MENAFAILANCWRLYHCHIYLNPDNVTTVVKATVVLHNILTLPNDKVCTDVVDNRAEIFDDAFEDLARKEVNLQQLPIMSESTLLTTSTVIVVLLNGKMIAHEIEFKIKVIILNKGTLMLSDQLVRHQLENQNVTMLILLKKRHFWLTF